MLVAQAITLQNLTMKMCMALKNHSETLVITTWNDIHKTVNTINKMSRTAGDLLDAVRKPLQNMAECMVQMAETTTDQMPLNDQLKYELYNDLMLYSDILQSCCSNRASK